MVRKKLLYVICFLILSGIFFSGCSGTDTPGSASVGSDESAKESRAPRDSTPQVLVPAATGTLTLGNDLAAIDISNTSDGYFMVQYLGNNDKVKLRVLGPDGSEYVYLLSDSHAYETFPLPCGSGSYQIQILENTGDDMYAVAYAGDFEAAIADEFAPFLYPNQYVNFNEDSLTVEMGSELASGAYSDLEVIGAIYHYIIENIAYDTEKAENVAYGYLPSIDETLTSKKGICFDYAAVMSAMLRTQRIPTKLEIGYSGEAYHAWISAYVTEIGWVDGIIQFDGSSWTLIDPTLAANNSSASVKQYIGDASNYVVKYSY